MSSSLRDELAAASATLEQAHRDHEAAFGKLKEEHHQERQSWLQETNVILSRTKDEHEAAIRKIVAEHEEVLKQNEVQSSSVLHKTEEDYYNVLTKLRGDHAAALEKQSADAAATLERLKEAHAGRTSDGRNCPRRITFRISVFSCHCIAGASRGAFCCHGEETDIVCGGDGVIEIRAR